MRIPWQQGDKRCSRQHTGTDPAVIGHLAADDGPTGGIHDEPDVGFDAADFDVGFISHKGFPFAIMVLIDERFDADGCGFAVVGDLLVRDADVIQIFESLGGFAQGQFEVDMEGQAQSHDMCVVLAEIQGRCVLGQGVQVHAEKIQREFAVDVVELIFVFAVILFEVLLIHLF